MDEDSKDSLLEGFEEKEKERKRVENEQVPQMFVLREGALSATARQKVIDMIEKAYRAYPKDLEGQLQFLHFHIEDYLGKRTQILIYQKPAMEGHALYTNTNSFIEIQYGSYIYIIWQVSLLEDQETYRPY